MILYVGLDKTDLLTGGMEVTLLESHLVSKIFRSLTDISRQEWNALVPADGFYSSHEWLLGQEAADFASPIYSTIWHGNSLLASMVAYDFVTSEKMPIQLRTEDGQRLLWCGPRTGYHNVILTASHLSITDRQVVLMHLLDSLFEAAQTRGYSGLALPCLTNAAVTEWAQIARLTVDFAMAEAEFPVPDSLEDYFSSLPSKTRRNVRREIKAFAQAGYAIAKETLENCVDEVANLLANTQQKYGHAMDARDTRAFLVPQARTLNDRSIVFTCREERGELVGFALYFAWADALYGRVVGFDYARLRKAYEYFNLAYYQPIQLAVQRGLNHVPLGPGSLEAKGHHGAILKPLWNAAIVRSDGAQCPGIVLADTQSAHEQVQQLRRQFGRATRDSDWANLPCLSAVTPVTSLSGDQAAY